MAATLPNAIGLYRLSMPEAPGASSLLEGTNPLTGDRRIFVLHDAEQVRSDAELESALAVYESGRGPRLPRVLDHGRVAGLVYIAFEQTPGAVGLSPALLEGIASSWALEQTGAIVQAVYRLHQFGLAHGRLELSALRLDGGRSGRLVLPPPDLTAVLSGSNASHEERLADDARSAATLVSHILGCVQEDPLGRANTTRSKVLALESEARLRIDTLADVVSDVQESLDDTVAPSLDKTEPPSAARATPPAPETRSLIRLPNRYRVQREIARGGMGVVLEARDETLRREVALKVLLDAGSREAHARFLEEAQVQGQLEHPNICPVHELSKDLDGQPYFTMKRVRGEPLSARLRRIKNGEERHDLNALLGVFVKACDAIAFAHSRGVLHRDLKPANIMVGEFGEVQVMDWGIAKVGGGVAPSNPEAATAPVQPSAVSSDARSSGQALTQAGSAMGTPHYMPPEQFLAAEAVDERGDVYALGAILYEILTLTTPIDGHNLGSIIRQAQEGNIVEPSQRAKDRVVPRDLELATMKALALRRDDRYPSVALLRAEVQAFLDGRTMAGVRYSVAERVFKWTRRHRALVATAALALLVLAALSSVYVIELRAQYGVERQRVAETMLAEAKALAQSGRLAAARTRLLELDALPLEDTRPQRQGRLFAWSLLDSAPDRVFEIDLGFRVHAAKALPAQNRVVVAGERIEVWAMDTRTRIASFESSSAVIRQVEVAASGDAILVIDDAEHASVFQTAQRTPTWTKAKVRAAALLGRSRRVAFAQDTKVFVEGIDRDGGETAWDMSFPGPIDSIAVDPTESIALVRYQPQHLAVVHLRSRTIVRETALGAPLVEPLALSSGHQLIAGVRANSSELEILPMSVGARLEREQVGRWVGSAFTTLDLHTAPPTSIEFLPEGNEILVSDRSGQALLWSIQDRKVTRTFSTDHPEPLMAVSLPEADLAIGVSESGRLSAWPLWANPSRLKVQPSPVAVARAMSFSKSGALLWAHTLGDELIDTRSGELFAHHHGGVFDLEARTSASIRRRLAQASELLAVSASVDGSSLARATKSSAVVTSLSSAEAEWVLNLPETFEPSQVAVGTDGAPVVLFGAWGPEHSRLWGASSRDREPEVWAEDLLVSGKMVLSPRGDLLAFGGRPSLKDGGQRSCLVLVPLQRRGEIQCLDGHPGNVNDLAFSPRGTRLYTGGEDGRLIAFNLEETKGPVWVSELGARVRAIEYYDPLGLVFAGLETGTLVLLSWEGEQLLEWSAGTSAIIDLTLHASGRLAVATQDQSVQLLDVAPWLMGVSVSRLSRARASVSPGGGSSLEIEVEKLRADHVEKLHRAAVESQTVEALAYRGRDEALTEALEEARAASDRTLASRVLSYALRFQNDAAVEAALAAGAEPNHPDERGVVPLATAFMLGREDYAERLLRAGADLSASGALPPPLAAAQSPWSHALSSAAAPAPRRSRRQRPSPSVTRALDPAIVGTALEMGSLGLLEEAIRSGLSVGEARIGVNVESTLAHAVRTRRHTLAVRLLAAGVDPNTKDEETTPLVEACRLGDGPLVQLLLAHGADPNLVASNGLTPLSASFLSADPYPVAKQLLVGGAAPNLEDAFGRRPIELALMTPDAAVLRALISAKVDLGTRLAGGETALHRAVHAGRVEHLRALLAAGARMQPDDRGRTPIDVAKERSDPSIIGLLDVVR